MKIAGEKKMIRRIVTWLCFFALMAGLQSGCRTVSQQGPQKKDGVAYGVTEGAFRHRWWNYYERAMSFADGGFYDEAKQDLRAAINQREKDQRRARTYGMHFVDYFPHREMGIVYYKKGRLKQAVDELTLSLASVQSAKAQLYLDRARKALIRKQKLDKRPPVIRIESPAQPFLFNGFSVTIKGVANDDTFVQQITVGEKPVKIDVSNREIQFSEDVPVVPGRNRIPVRVSDISGKTSEVFVEIHVDRTGPVLRIDKPYQGMTVAGNRVLVEGYAFDDSGLVQYSVNGAKSPCDGVEVHFKREIPVSVDGKELLVEVRDRAGNVTSAAIDLSKGRESIAGKGGVSGGRDHLPPTIDLRDLEAEQATYLEQAFIEGCIQDDQSVGRLFVNNAQILKTPCKKAYFSHLVGLKEGENRIHIKGMDLSGNAGDKIVKILRDVLNVRQIGSRLCVAVGHFKRKTVGADRHLSHGVEDLLTADMRKRSRFRAVDRRRLKEVLNELKLSQSGLVDEGSALKAGRILAADCMLFGSVLERTDSVEIYVRLVDTETTEILAAVDVYGEGVDIGKLREISKGLDLKLTHALPVVEGRVIKMDGDRMIVDMGKKARVANGMKLIVYEIGEPIRNPADGSIMGLDVKKLGQARIESVMEKMSFADLLGESDGKGIRPMHSVITR